MDDAEFTPERQTRPWTYLALAWSTGSSLLSLLVITQHAEWSRLTLGHEVHAVLWVPRVGGWIAAAFLASIIGGARLANVKQSPIKAAITSLVLFGILAASCWMSLRAGIIVEPDHVVVRAGEPWKSDQTLALDGLEQVVTGCSSYSGRSTSYYPYFSLVFSKPDAQIDLGRGVGSADLPIWIDRMAEVVRLPQFERAKRQTNLPSMAKCVERLEAHLDEQHQRELLDLLGA